MQTTIRGYRILEEIHKGGKSRVYRAVHLPDSGIVAFKTIPKEKAQRETGHKLFRSEQKFYFNLRHNNIVTLLDCFVYDDLYCFVMEYVDGYNLKHCIGRRCICSADHNSEINHHMDAALKICEGLVYLHSQKIVHGHIKPENILVSRNVTGPDKLHEHVKINDFTMGGIVRGVLNHSIQTRRGSLLYLSPEQVSEKRTTFQSDIFSLGITFYELFSGHHPWGKSPTEKDLIAELLSPHAHPVPPSQLAPWLPRHIDQVIMKMLEKKEENRSSSMIEVWLGLSNIETIRI
jgi:serine/threonine-protein kinase